MINVLMSTPGVSVEVNDQRVSEDELGEAIVAGGELIPEDCELVPDRITVFQTGRVSCDEEVFYVSFKVWSTLKRTVGLFFRADDSEEWQLISCNLGDVIEGGFETSGEYTIAVGWYAERALYHELYHVMETRLLTDSTAFDRWDALNPKGFTYDLDYTANRSRQAEQYLQPTNRSFVDTYSMSYPKEDRARIMETAMCDGNEELFRSSTMQGKLRCLSQAIREAYGLKKSTETFRWEQYLKP